MDRRTLLKGFAGCSLAAHPLVTPIAFAGSPESGRLGDNRLVVIILRGAMDGLDAVQPYGDSDFRKTRRTLKVGPDQGAIDLDGFYAMHEKLAPLHPLWQAGELGFMHAASTPYRDKRSHFDGQDILEAGTGGVPGPVSEGWLNRMLQQVPGLTSTSAYSVGLEQMPVLAGQAPVSDWSPDIGLSLSPQGRRLLDLVVHDDKLFQSSAGEALDILSSLSRDPGPDTGGEALMMMDQEVGANLGNSATRFSKSSTGRIAEFTANRLQGNSRIAAFSINGWDTHSRQRVMLGRALDRLALTILRLRQDLGPVWAKTTVLALTEFGRTVEENGTSGTDHGTGGVALFAGGAVRGKQVVANWPGLAEADRYNRRDLMPTRDVRSLPAWAMRGLYGFDRALLEDVIFPGLDMGSDPGIIA